MGFGVYVLPVAGTISLVVSAVIASSKRYFWNDELYSYFLLSDPSFRGMLGAFHDAINNTPPLYFVLGWLWVRPFGAGELSLRLFSSLAMCVALWLTWLALRRVYGTWPASLGTLAVFCTSGIILSQNAEARMYGLFLALSAAALFLYARATPGAPVARGMVIATVGVHAALVLTHLFGPVYSGAFVVALVVSDARVRAWRPGLYAAIGASWIAFALYLPSFLVQAEAGNPRSWLPLPELGDLVELLALRTPGLLRPWALAALLLAVGLHQALSAFAPGRARSGEEGMSGPYRSGGAATHLLVLGLVLIAVPVAAWLVSRTLRPIFLDRYLIPTTLGWSILLSHMIARLIADPVLRGEGLGAGRIRLASLGSAAVFLAIGGLFVLEPLTHARNVRPGTQPGLRDDALGYADLPVVVQNSHRFLERDHYSPERLRYFFILDWEAAVDEASGAFGPQEYKHLEAIRRNYPDRFAGRIVSTEEFLGAHERFLVLDNRNFDRTCPLRMKGFTNWAEIHCPQWVERRILGDPAYELTVLGGVDDGVLLLVEGVSRDDTTPNATGGP